MITENNIYQEKGYKNRKDYLECLTEEFDLPRQIVFKFAQFLGETEDFDGLVTMLEDFAEEFHE